MADRRVLVIDEYAGGRAAICACVSEFGCIAIGTSSRIADCDLPWHDLVDVVVAYHDPPLIDAGALVVRLRRNAPGLPVIVTTSLDRQAEARRLLTDEFTLVRRFSVNDLLRAMDTLVPAVETDPRLSPASARM